jgi:uncharacterized membrane protein
VRADSTGARGRGRPVAAGVLLGIGVGGFVDETVFHQLLHWHHFWDGGGQAAGLVSDGAFHAGSWVCTVAGLFWFADLRRRGAWQAAAWLGGVLLGAGGFQLYDGLVQHKLLRLHQVRSVPDLLPYDLAWDLAGAVALVLGAVLVLRRRPSAPG